ncbi:MAG TPA: nucleotidyltransferase domain-containing protein [Phototrophicaceae bacterium]|jgi:predicted nucleotidyltransferase|nr:nucleotidyltransferase domain-containing protein [Phototrophicaceae bacterium]
MPQTHSDLNSGSYSGTPHHQALLTEIVNYYRDDPRILAVCLFGSLVRGNWNQYSDLDLDIVLADDVQINVMAELEKLCAVFHLSGKTSLMIIPDGDDAGNVVLQSKDDLIEFSIRYHPLATTSPNIIDSLQILIGTIDAATMQQAAGTNRKPPHSISEHDINRLLRWALEINIRLHRQQFWQAVYLLQLMREALINIFAFSRDFPRAYHAFEAVADSSLKSRVAATFPDGSLVSIQRALDLMLHILEDDLEILSNGQLELTATAREIIARLRGSRATL